MLDVIDDNMTGTVGIERADSLPSLPPLAEFVSTIPIAFAPARRAGDIAGNVGHG